MNSTWKITMMRDGSAVSSVEGVSQENAIKAVRNAMYGRDVLTDVNHSTRESDTQADAVAA
jgi:hypothetical protein